MALLCPSPIWAHATNKFNDGDQAIDLHIVPALTGPFLADQLIPLEEVAIIPVWEPPSHAIATNNPNLSAQQTPLNVLFKAVPDVFQAKPSDEYKNKPLSPVVATNNFNCGDQAIVLIDLAGTLPPLIP